MPHAQSQITPGVPAASPNSDVVVIVPMYNEAEVLSGVVNELVATFPHVVCVDDGSSDGSAALASAAGATVVRHPSNLGQGAALQTGLLYALRTPAAYLASFDADGQHRVDDLLAMLREARRGDVDIVLGSRFLDPTSTTMPRLRRTVLRAGVLFTRITTGLELTDTHNGLRVMTRHTACLLKLRLHGMAHASEILSTVARQGLRFAEMPMTVVYSDYSRAKGQSSVNAVNVLIDLMLARARYAR